MKVARRMVLTPLGVPMTAMSDAQSMNPLEDCRESGYIVD